MTITHLPITGLPIGEVSARVIVCGDPARAGRIAEQLDDASLISHKREYQAHRGIYHGAPISVCSHGIGAPGAAIAFEELIAAGAKTIIRVGTCGGLQPEIRPGHLIIAAAAVQNTGYGREIVPEGFPATADIELTQRLWRVTHEAQQPPTSIGHIGIILSRDSFYGGVMVPTAPDYRIMSQAGVLAVEMECAALFLVGHLRKVRTAAILVADGNVLEVGESMDTYSPGNEVVQKAVDSAAHYALETLTGIV